MMFGFGWIMMLVVIGVPLLLVALLVGVGVEWYQRWNQNNVVGQTPTQGSFTVANPLPPAPNVEKYCSHCGAGLQPSWTHCPQCGAPIQ